MRAAFHHDKRDLRIDEVNPEPVGADEVRIAVAYGAVCGTDLHLYAHGRTGAESRGAAVPAGHEFSGRVVEAGPAVRAFRVGDRVTAIPGGPCNRCTLCRTGRQSMCRNRVSARTGAWAESIVVPSEIVYRLPEDVSDRAGAITEPLACAIRAVDRSGLRSADRVAVIGGGPLGLLILMVAKATGARTVVVSEPSSYRRALAERLGADRTVDPSGASLKDVMSDLTEGYGPDVVFEVVGRRATIEQAVDIAAPGGTVVIAGVPEPDVHVEIPPAGVFYRELTIRGTKGITHGMDRALRWLGAMDVEPLLTHTFPLARAVDAVELSLAGDCGKVLIQVSP